MIFRHLYTIKMFVSLKVLQGVDKIPFNTVLEEH